MSEIAGDVLKGVKGGRTALKFGLKAGARFSPEIAKLAENTAVKALVTKSPIISAAQATILAMNVTLGYPFTPDDGAEIDDDSKAFDDIAELLGHASPDETWEGTGSDAYVNQNKKQRSRAEQLVEVDAEVRRIIAEEARQITTTRKTLTDMINWLTSYDLATCWMYAFPPEGPATKQGLDFAAVAGVMPTVYQSYTAMINAAGTNSSGLQNAVTRYNEIARGTNIDQMYAIGRLGGSVAQEKLSKWHPTGDVTFAPTGNDASPTGPH